MCHNMLMARRVEMMKFFRIVAFAGIALAIRAAEPPEATGTTGSEFSAAFWMTVAATPCEEAATIGPLSVSAAADGRWAVIFRAQVEDLTGDYVCTTRDAFGRGERHHLEVSYSLMRRRVLVRVDGRLQYENDRLVLPQLVTGDVDVRSAKGVRLEDVKIYDFALPTDELALDSADPRRTVAAARRAADAAAKRTLFSKWDPSGTKPAAIYAVNPYAAEQFTPYHLPEKGAPGETMRLFAAPDQQVSGSALVVALKASLTVAGVRVGALRTKDGMSFPAKSVDVKLVKRWFRCGGAWISYIGDKRQRHLTSDLLVNDDALVKVDEWRERNYLRLDYPEGTRYVDVSDPDAGHLDQRFNAQVPFRDAETVQPVTIGEYGRTQQFLLTFDVGKDVKSGLYTGEVEFVGAGSMRVELNILPIELPEQGSPYGNLSRSYISLVNCFPPPVGRTLAEKEESIRRAFRAVKGHRLVHTASMWDTPEYLRLGKEECMIAPDRVFSHRMAWIPDWRSFYPGRSVSSLTEADREAAEKVVERQLAPSVDFLMRYFPDHPDTYAIFFSEDSYYYDLVGTQEGQAAVAHRLGYKVYGHTMGNADEVVIAGDLEDLMADTSISPKAAEMWHEAGGEMINYADPFPGSENPAIFRRKLGLEMYKAGYDGDMMHECINLPEPFNEFLGGRYRNFCMGIPQQGGVIWKLAYDGMREAMNDVRYLTALKKAATKLREDPRPEVSREAKRQLVWLAALDGKTADPDMVRAAAADRILILNGYLKK